MHQRSEGSCQALRPSADEDQRGWHRHQISLVSHAPVLHSHYLLLQSPIMHLNSRGRCSAEHVIDAAVEL
jgi:hypothetical protein